MVGTDLAKHAAARLYEILAAVERGEIAADTPAEQAMLERIERVLALYEERPRDASDG